MYRPVSTACIHTFDNTSVTDVYKISVHYLYSTSLYKHVNTVCIQYHMITHFLPTRVTDLHRTVYTTCTNMYFSKSVTQRIRVCNRMLTPTSCYRRVDILLCSFQTRCYQTNLYLKHCSFFFVLTLEKALHAEQNVGPNL